MPSISIGQNTILPTADNGNGNTLLAQTATLTQSATLQTLSFYVTTPGGQLILGIYDATGPGGNPGNLLATTVPFTPVTGWNTQPVITPVLLGAATYWLAYLPASNTLAFVNVQSGSAFYNGYTFAAMPAVFPTASGVAVAVNWSLYATLVTPTVTITINAIPTPTPNTAFAVAGSMQNQPAIPTLTYADNGGPASALPGGSSVGLTTFNFTHPGMPAGNDTLIVSDGTNQGQTSYAVVTPGWNNLAATSSLSNIITGLTASTAYDIEVYATNTAGQGPPSAIITVTTSAVAGPVLPGAPTGLALTASAQTTVNLSWVAPTTGTPPYLYGTQWSPTGANTWTSGPSVSTTSAQITGLTAGTTYDFQVNAANSAGSGPFSTLLTATTAAVPPIGVTWQPTGASATVTFSNGNLTATSGATSPQSCVSTTSITSSSLPRQFEATMTTGTIDWQVGICNQSFNLGAALGLDNNGVAFNLEFNTTVFCGSAAALSTGVSSSVNGDVATVVFDPSVPRIWVSSQAMRAAGFAWNNSATATPSTLTGGISLAGLLTTGSYSACFNERQAGGIAVGNFGATAFTVPLSSNVLAWNGASATVVIPGSVTSLLAGTPTPNSVSVSWVAPTTGTLAFTYTVWVSPHGAGTYTANVTSIGVTSATVTGLSTSTSYDLRVSAANGAGAGGFSNVVNIITAAPITIPGAPSGLSAGAATSTSVALTWVPPTTGSLPTGYQVQYKLSTAGTWTNFSPTVPE